jgi:PBSX family phage terminase large subunit
VKAPPPFTFKSFSRKQKKVLTWWKPGSPYREHDGIICDGAIRSGKTIAFIVSFVLWSQTEFSGESFIVAGKSMGALKRNVLRPMFAILAALGIAYTYNRSENYVVVGSNTYYCFGANNEASQDVLQGLTAAGALADEVALFPWSFVEQMIARCSTEGSKLWFNCNPENPYHEVKRELIDHAEDKMLLHLHFTMDDNLTLSAKVKERYKRLYSGVWFKRFILGLWCMAEGAIYDMLDESVHVVDTLPAMREYHVGVDYGTGSVTCFWLLGIGTDNRLYLVDRWRWDAKDRMKQKTDSQFADDMNSWLIGLGIIPRFMYVPADALSFMNQLHHTKRALQEAGKPCNLGTVAEADRSPGSVLDGIRDFGSLLSAMLLFFSRKVADDGGLVEFQGYVWDEKKQQLGEDAPLKQNDHDCFVAGTMVETYAGLKPIETVTTSDMVLTRRGYKPVIDCGITSPNAQVYTLETSDGRTLTGSGNHPIWVKGKGYLPLDTLRYGDIIEVWKPQISLYSTGSDFDVISTQRTGQTATTTPPANRSRCRVLEGCMRKYGRLPTAPFQKVARFITRMRILSTIHWTIWNVLRNGNTASDTEKQECNMPNRLEAGLLWKRLVLHLWTGTKANRVASGTVNMPNAFGLMGNESFIQDFATSAASHMKHCQTINLIDSARTPANQHGGDTKGLMTKTVSAQYAGSSIGSTNIPDQQPAGIYVVRVSAQSKPQPIYNLSVADVHEYYANGILVHNCDSCRYVVTGTKHIWYKWLARKAA